MRIRLRHLGLAVLCCGMLRPGTDAAAASLQAVFSGVVTTGYTSISDGVGGMVDTNLAGTAFSLRYIFDTAETVRNELDTTSHYQRSDFRHYTVEVTLVSGTFAISATAPSDHNGYLSLGAGLSQGTFGYDYLIAYAFDDPRRGHFLYAESISYSYDNAFVPSESFEQTIAYALQPNDPGSTRFQYVDYALSDVIYFEATPSSVGLAQRLVASVDVPEPTSGALLFASIALLGIARRGRG